MTDQTVKVREVAWSQLFPWLMLFRSVRIALMARVLILGALGLIATTLGWRAIGWLFSGYDNSAMEYWQASLGRWVWQHTDAFEIAMSARNADEVFQSAWAGVHEAPVELWLYLTNPFRGMFSQVPPSVFFYLLFCAIWELLVWGLIGGAITRIAALKFTRDEAPGLVASLQHAFSKLPSYSLPPLVALGGAGVFAIQLVALGALMRLDIFALLIGFVWFFVLMLGLLMAFLLLGVLVGWPLMWATISVEGTDAFDALSRSYAYTYHRPWRLLWYVLVVGLLAIVSMFVVKLFAATAINLGDWSIDWGLDNPTMQDVVRQVDDVDELPSTVAPPALAVTPNATTPPVATADTITTEDPGPQDSRLRRWAARAIYFWKSLMAAISAGYQAGFLWASAVGVYLLLRRDIDGVQMNEVYVEQDEQYGLPPLAEDMATGVPEVVTDQSARKADVANPSNLPRGD